MSARGPTNWLPHALLLLGVAIVAFPIYVALVASTLDVADIVHGPMPLVPGAEGPASYSAERGHPRLRMRHAPFAIGGPERDAWYRHMATAVKAGQGPSRPGQGEDGSQ